MSEWISVKTSLPRMFESYDFSGREVEVSEIVATNEGAGACKDGEWVGVDWDPFNANVPMENITHWMPLPEPPKEQEK